MYGADEKDEAAGHAGDACQKQQRQAGRFRRQQAASSLTLHPRKVPPAA
jgi:hypothetical protein